MLLDNFVEIISGKILNSPCISSINKLTSSLESLQLGDAYIAIDKNSIQEALERGAYAIITDSCLEIVDDEIAWILVSDMEISMLKFIKYMVLTTPSEIFFFDEISFLLAKNIIKDKSVGFASNARELLESLDKRYIIINFDIFLFDIARLQDCTRDLLDVTSQTLFETKLIFGHEEYHLTIPKIFIKDLNNVIAFCTQRFIHIILHIDSGMFLPIFISSNATISHYGCSMRFVYGVVDSTLLRRYIDFVNTATWGKSLCITNHSYDGIPCIGFSSLESLRILLRDSKYHFFIIDGIKQDEIANILKDSTPSPSLFDC